MEIIYTQTKEMACTLVSNDEVYCSTRATSAHVYQIIS
jgi:hypothetical protein